MNQLKEQASLPTYSFGPFRLDPAQHHLLRDGRNLRLPPKVFETLVLLVERRGLLVDKDELMKALWPETFVEEVTLARNVSLLRKALGDPPGQDQCQYIQTVSKRGYRFIAPVTEFAPQANQSCKSQAIESEISGLRIPDILNSQAPLLDTQNPKISPRFLWTGVPVFALAILTIWWISFRMTHVKTIHSIAVLPFVDESKDASSQYIIDGITEGLINKLSEIQGLRVISRNSVFKYKGKETDAQVIGKDLKVQAVLISRIAHQEDVVTISAELVNVSDGSQIWGRQLRYPISDLPHVQDELAAVISGELKLRLNSADEARLARPATDNPDAYRLYLQARYHWNRRTPSDIKNSLELFQQATEKDPDFALAYVGIADAYNMGNNLGVFTPRESMPEAKVATTKALVLDPRLAEAHTLLGQVKSHYDFDFPGAQREFLKAIELNPNYAYGHLYYAGGYLTPMGRHAEAIAEVKKALELDPLSSAVSNYLGMTYVWAGDYQKSAEQFQHTIDMDPTFPLAHFFFVDCLTEIGKYEQAIQEWQRGALLEGEEPERVAAWTAELLRAFHTGGPNGYWRKNLEQAVKEHKAGTGGSLVLASAYARVGDEEMALEWLQKAYEERENITLVNSDPAYKSLRQDPRFSAMLTRIGLPN